MVRRVSASLPSYDSFFVDDEIVLVQLAIKGGKKDTARQKNKELAIKRVL